MRGAKRTYSCFKPALDWFEIGASANFLSEKWRPIVVGVADLSPSRISALGKAATLVANPLVPVAETVTGLERRRPLAAPLLACRGKPRTPKLGFVDISERVRYDLDRHWLRLRAAVGVIAARCIR